MYNTFIYNVPTSNKNVLIIQIKKVLEKVKRDFQILNGEDLKILQAYATVALKANTLYFGI